MQMKVYWGRKVCSTQFKRYIGERRPVGRIISPATLHEMDQFIFQIPLRERWTITLKSIEEKARDLKELCGVITLYATRKQSSVSSFSAS